MEFEWDEVKRQANLVKHGLDFADVAAIDWTSVKLVPDRRVDYGEDRFRAFARIEGELHSMAVVFRGSAIRVLSFRRANRKERRIYG